MESIGNEVSCEDLIAISQLVIEHGYLQDIWDKIHDLERMAAPFGGLHRFKQCLAGFHQAAKELKLGRIQRKTKYNIRREVLDLAAC